MNYIALVEIFGANIISIALFLFSEGGEINVLFAILMEHSHPTDTFVFPHKLIYTGSSESLEKYVSFWIIMITNSRFLVHKNH